MPSVGTWYALGTRLLGELDVSLGELDEQAPWDWRYCCAEAVRARVRRVCGLSVHKRPYSHFINVELAATDWQRAVMH